MRMRWPLCVSFLSLVVGVRCTSGPTVPTAHDHAASTTGPVSSTGVPMSASHEHGGHPPSNDGGDITAVGSLPPGYALVPLTQQDTARLNLTRATVEERDFKRTVRTVGAVTADGTRSSHVHPKLRGWVEEIFVNYTGQTVRKGAPLCTIYSPEILAAELELLAVFDRAKAPTGVTSGEFAAIEQRARDVTLEAARRRLFLWDVPPSEIERLESTREPKKAFPLLAPRSGTVVAKQAVAGMYVDASTELYFVSDLSRVWVVVDLYEGDVLYVKVGDKAHLSIEGLSGAPRESAITFIEPTIDEPTRTLKARFELDNRDGRLRPGAFVTAEMHLDAGRGLGVPESAVIRTGSRNVVFVIDANAAAPREVKLGPLVGGFYHVPSGLRAGEQVATGAQFLLDSESRIRATSSPGAAHAH
jgi:membrane fusion protein, copper/silver efflux system